MREQEYDFFISHASEDKDLFVRPFVEKLINKGYKIWYDEMSLNLGDSLIENISNGIKKSLYGIIVLSKNFFKKKWTKKELEALLSKEIITDRNLILPIWLDIDIREVYEFSPLLVDKLAISIKSNDIDIAITKLEKKFNLTYTSEEMIREKIEFLLKCNIDRRNKYFLDLEKRIKDIFLYQQEYYNWYMSDETFNDEKPWDDIIVAKKDNEFKIEYNIPAGVWTNPEPFSWKEIERAIKLCSKWVFRKLTYTESHELYFLLEEWLDTDVHYILYSFPHSSIKNKDLYKKSIQGIFEVGIKDPAKRMGTRKEYKDGINSILRRSK